jgi:hypothetical protein
VHQGIEGGEREEREQGDVTKPPIITIEITGNVTASGTAVGGPASAITVEGQQPTNCHDSHLVAGAATPS